MEFSDNIKEFIEICRSQNESTQKKLTDETIEKLGKISGFPLIEIMLNSYEIHEELGTSVSPMTEYHIYSFIFSKDIYLSVKDLIGDFNQTLGCYIHAGFVLESLKLKIGKKLIEFIIPHIERTEGLEKIMATSFFDVFVNENNKSIELLKIIYDDLKTNYNEEEIHLNSIKIINEYNIPINI